jgi:hypothetical protein
MARMIHKDSLKFGDSLLDMIDKADFSGLSNVLSTVDSASLNTPSASVETAPSASLSGDIDDINEMIGVVPECEPYRDSWQRIKTALVELGISHSATTKPMPKCLCLSCSRLQSNGGSCQTNAFVTACGGYSDTSA